MSSGLKCEPGGNRASVWRLDLSHCAVSAPTFVIVQSLSSVSFPLVQRLRPAEAFVKVVVHLISNLQFVSTRSYGYFVERWPLEEPSVGRRNASTRSVVQLSQAVTNHNVHESVTSPSPLWLEPWLVRNNGRRYNDHSVKSEEGLPFLARFLFWILLEAAEKIASYGEGECDIQSVYPPGLGAPGSSWLRDLLIANVPQIAMPCVNYAAVPCVRHESAMMGLSQGFFHVVSWQTADHLEALRRAE